MKNKLFLPLVLALCFSNTCISAEVPNSTNVDDYTNSKNGTSSKVYHFNINGSDKLAFGKGQNSTDMTWEQWLNINAEKLNTDGYHNVTTSGGSSTAKTTYYVKYDVNNGAVYCNLTNPDNDVVYSGGTIKTPNPSCAGYTFNGWYNSSNKFASGNEDKTINSDLPLQAKWTRNELNFNDQEVEYDYSVENSSKDIRVKASNGSGSYTYSLVNAVTGFSVSPDGKITHGADALGGKYTLKIKVVDNNTKAEKTVNYTVKIKPVLDINFYPISVGDKNVEIFMSGLNSGATASSSQASEMKMNSNLFSFKTVLNNAFSQSSNFGFKVSIDGITWDYTVKLGKSPKFLSVNSVYVTYNNADQTPKFYSDISGYEGQQNYFDWSICDINGNNCSGTSRKNASDYKVKLNVKSQYACSNMETECTQTKPIAFYDPSTGTATTNATINFIIDKFELKPMGQADGNTTVSAAKEYTYDGSVFSPDVNVVVTINGKNITLNQGTDYEVSTVQDLTGAGEYDLTISGKGNYKGTIKNAGKINVKKQSIPNYVTEKNNGEYISADGLWKVYYNKTHYYTGSPITPSVVIEYKHKSTVKKDNKVETIVDFFALKEGTDYSISYKDNTNVGTGKIVITGKVSNVKLFNDSLVEIIGDIFDCYDLIINLFGGQCQII